MSSGSWLTGLPSGTVVDDRYRIVKILGQGGFGRTYLAEDNNRFQEYCVLKEFVPRSQKLEVQQKALTLFQREADVLYRLRHGQIPRFQALVQTQVQDHNYLFLVQTYIPGPTYRELLQIRQAQGQCFQEADVVQLLHQLLPVLAYLHANGVIHRDISLENLIQRQPDQLPVLIDFGGVKQAVFSSLAQTEQLTRKTSFTCIGKAGYAPAEQLQQGKVYPHSDLYALAASILVLLTGQEPMVLIDPQTLEWQWHRRVSLSPQLTALLQRMLARSIDDRYPSATAILLALSDLGDTSPSSLSPTSPSPISPAVVAPSLPRPTVPSTDSNSVSSQPGGFVLSRRLLSRRSLGSSRNRGESVAEPRFHLNSRKGLFGIILLLPLLTVSAGLSGRWLTRVGQGYWQQWRSSNSIVVPADDDGPGALGSDSLEPDNLEPDNSITPIPMSPEEEARKIALAEQRQTLGIRETFLNALVNDRFYQKYPNLQGQRLNRFATNAPLRLAWDQIAQDWLTQLTALKPTLRQKLGSYDRADLDIWIAQVNEKFLSSHSLIDLTDNAFLSLLAEQQPPQLSSSQFLGQIEDTPLMQIWWALAEQTTQDILNRTRLKELKFKPNTSQGRIRKTLNPGEGMAYITYLVAQQPVQFQLQAPQQFFLSIYSPSPDHPPLLSDSEQHQWEGILQESGYYEVVIVSTAPEVETFTLKVVAEPDILPQGDILQISAP